MSESRFVADFAVIGAGIAGASAAYELAAYGSVVLLEAESQAGYHTTGRSAAFFSEAYGNPIVRALTICSREFLDSPPPAFAEHPLLIPGGGMYIGREDQRGAVEELFAAASSNVDSIVLEDGKFATELVPALRPGYVHSCVWEPEARAIDVNELLQAFLRGARSRGVEIKRNARVTSMSRQKGFWRLLSTDTEFHAAIVINAAGAWADEIGKLAGGNPIGLIPKRRTVCLFDPPSEIDISQWPLVVDVDEEFYFKPDAGKILLSPADETPMVPQDVQPDDLDVAVAVDRLEKATVLNVKRIDHKWAGLRSFVADKIPVVGFGGDVEGFFWLAGQGGYGIATSPAMARCTAALATGSDLPEDLRKLGVNEDHLSPARCRIA